MYMYRDISLCFVFSYEWLRQARTHSGMQASQQGLLRWIGNGAQVAKDEVHRSARASIEL